jgi:hypothetical protein
MSLPEMYSFSIGIKAYARFKVLLIINNNNFLYLGFYWKLETLMRYDDQPTLVTFFKQPHIQYIIHNLAFEWASCNCLPTQHENIYKHALKMLMFLHIAFAKGTIVRFCGSLEGIAQGGLQNILSVNHSTMPNMGLISPPSWKIVTLMHEDMEDQVLYLAMDLVDVVMCGNQV